MKRLLSVVLCLIVCHLALLAQQDARQPSVTKISLPEPAYIGMPIWMEVVSATGYKIHYPSSTTPNDFYCNQVEVKQNGRLLPAVTGSPAAGRAGGACGWLGMAGIAESKLPIHLQYLLTEPGTYMVRFTRREYRREKRGEQIGEQSDWLPMHLRVAPTGTVEQWLTGELAALPVTPGRLLGDALPSLLASRDPRVLRLMIDTSYNPDPLVAAYAANSLELFDPMKVRPMLLSVLHGRGPNDALGYLFGSRGNIIVPIAAQIVAVSLPYLHSSNPTEVEGAVHVLSILRDPYYGLPPETLAQIASALQADIDLIVSQSNEKAAWWVANFLGATRPPNGRELLWKLIDAGLAEEQTLICVAWYKNPSDLPRLTAIVKQDNPTDPHGRSHSGIVMHFGSEYGDIARPYLRDLLATSQQTWVRTAAAKDLVQMNDPAGWEFFIGVIHQRPFYRDEMVQWLGDNFPAIRGADDPAIVTFLESRLSTTTGPEHL